MDKLILMVCPCRNGMAQLLPLLSVFQWQSLTVPLQTWRFRRQLHLD
ncbi:MULTISPECIES: hypothetical protein [Enterobacter cloacae complex]|nr:MULTISPECIES: hypothetical protein [Enterobacter cloacae complex]MCM7082996.1 hypothetical protein [Enterobacter roggenkampii]UUR70692.1 hypothetical protein NQ230_12770 [Enterobacter asburiae]